MHDDNVEEFFAHTGNTKNGADWQPLIEHLLAVGVGASEHAKAIDAYRSLQSKFESQSLISGWLHDLGKYRAEFQDYLFSRPVEPEKRYHKQAGASKAVQYDYFSVAFAIAGHHGGLPTQADLKTAVVGPSGSGVCKDIWEIACRENAALTSLSANNTPATDRNDIEFQSRILLSCLVDADWRDTENYRRVINCQPIEPRMPALSVESATVYLSRLLQYISQRASATSNEKIKAIRNEVLSDCLASAMERPGLFSLSVPTGGGKTLSAMAFALKHCAQHRMRRVIYVAPFLSIIDQNAEVLRKALGFAKSDLEFFAHHSLAEAPDIGTNDSEKNAAARRAENWDSPLIVTTNVQFFESLFANKPSKVRKLHNIAGSVVILDECQAIPAGLITPTCAMLKQLSKDIGCTIVFCSATQPAFAHRQIPEQHRIHTKEIISTDRNLVSRLCRVRLVWPSTVDECLSWEDVSDMMLNCTVKPPASLCIVNTRRAARELFFALQARVASGVFHLSTTMCPAHRMLVLRTVKRRLVESRPCYLISTQLIEAGVDVDFPLVLREMAPLESIIQAAGRCNREGLLKDSDGTLAAKTIVFRSEAARDEPARYYPPDQWYKAGRSTLEANFLAFGRQPQLDDQRDISDYYERLFENGNLDSENINSLRSNLDFPAVAERYRLIQDDSVAIVTGTWAPQSDKIQKLLNRLHKNPSRSNFRKLAPFQINVRRNLLGSDVGRSIAKPFEDLDLRVWYGGYDDSLGTNTESNEVLMVV